MADIDHLMQDIGDNDRQVSCDAANALARSGDPRAVGVLVAYLADTSRLKRSNVAGRLFHFHPDLVIEPLIRAMAADDWSVRYAAFWSCVHSKDVRAIPAMIDLLKYVADGHEETDAAGVNDDYSTYSMIHGIGEMCTGVSDPTLFREAVTPLRHFLGDPRMKARAAATRSLAALGEDV